MHFKQATDGLFDRISHLELAKTLGVSVAAIRQARLNRTAKSYRGPPKGWQNAVIVLAQKRIGRLRELITALKSASSI